MQGQQDARRFFDLSDPFDIQVLPRFSLNHGLEHAVPVCPRRERGYRYPRTRRIVCLPQETWDSLKGPEPLCVFRTRFRYSRSLPLGK